MQEQKSTNFHIAEILFFIVGAACAVAVMYFLVMPAFQSEHSAEIARIEQRIVEVEEARDIRIAEIEVEVEEMQSEVEEMQSIVAARDTEIARQDRIIRVHHAYTLYSNDQLQESIDALNDINMAGLPPDIVERAANIREGAYPVLGLASYNAGLAAFTLNPRDVYLARVSLEAAFYFMTEDATQWNELLFMLGTIYYDDERLDEAEDLLYNLRERAPNHRPQATTNMLNSIEAQR